MEPFEVDEITMVIEKALEKAALLAQNRSQAAARPPDAGGIRREERALDDPVPPDGKLLARVERFSSLISVASQGAVRSRPRTRTRPWDAPSPRAARLGFRRRCFRRDGTSPTAQRPSQRRCPPSCSAIAGEALSALAVKNESLGLFRTQDTLELKWRPLATAEWSSPVDSTAAS
jgi:hypothetical protein